MASNMKNNNHESIENVENDEVIIDTETLAVDVSAFSEVKRKSSNHRTTEEKAKSQASIANSGKEGKQLENQEENKNVPKGVKKAIPQPQTSRPASQASNPKVFGKDFVEAPVPKVNPWTRKSNTNENKSVSTTPTKNTNAAETSMNARARSSLPDSAATESPRQRIDASLEVVQRVNENHVSSQPDHKKETLSNPKSPDCSPPSRKLKSQSLGESFRQRSRPSGSQENKMASSQTSNPAHKTSNKFKNWEKKIKDSNKNADLNDSLHWPRLEATEPAQDQPKTQLVAKQIKDDATESASGSEEQAASNQAPGKKKNKQKWIALPVDLGKTERRRGGGGGRGRGGASRSFGHFDDQDRSQRRPDRPPYRRNKNRDNQTQEERVDGAGEREKSVPQRDPNNRSFRGRRGQSRGRGYFNRNNRDNTVVQNGDNHSTPFFLPSFYPSQAAGQNYAVYTVPTYYKDLEEKILSQIDYYFSEQNLEGDFFMRRQMDEEGWVDVDLIKTFRKLRALTNDSSEIVKAMMKSGKVELSDDKTRLRAKENPDRWTLVGVGAPNFSILNADAPVFIPGQMFLLPETDDEPQTSQETTIQERSNDDERVTSERRNEDE